MSCRLTKLSVLLVLLLGACGDPSAEESIQRAESYQRKGDIPASIIELKNALQKEPQNAQARFLLGQTYLTIRDLPGAEKELLRARDAGYSPEKLVKPLTDVWLEQGQFHDVLNELHVETTSTKVYKAAVLIAHGRAHQALGDLGAAEQDYEGALDYAPDNIETLVGLARVSMQMKDDSRAKTAAARASEIAPDDLNVLAVLADLSFRSGDYDSAKIGYERVLRAQPGSIAVQLVLARVELALGQPEQAKENLDAVLARASTHPDANYLRATLAVDDRDYQAAARFSERALITKPDHGPSLLIAGTSNYVLGRLEQAERHLLRLLAQDPSNKLARQVHAAIQLRLNRSRAARRASPRLLDDSIEPRQLLDIEDATTRQRHYLAAGQALFDSLAENDGDQSLTWPPIPTSEVEAERARLHAALEAAPGNLALLSNLGRLEVQIGNSAEAATLFGRAIKSDPYALTPRVLLGQLDLRLGHPGKALEVAEVALREHPKDAALLGLVGLADLSRGNIQEAKLRLRDLVDLRPKSAAVHYLLALAYHAEGEEVLYKDRLGQVLKLDPSHLPARLAQAKALARAGDLETAAMQVTAIMRDAAEDLDVLDLAGTLALLQEQPDEAVTNFAKAASKAPSSQRVLTLAYAQQRAGDMAASIGTLERWLLESPSDLDVRMALANKYLRAGRLGEARGHFAEIILLAPNNVVALNNLAWIALQKRETETALDYGERAYLLAPDNGRVLDTYGTVLLRAGEVEQAVAMLRRAKKTSSGLPGIDVNLARALSEQGNMTEARQILDNLLSRNSEFPERQEAEALAKGISR